MRTITRRLEVDAGHRLLNHEGKCQNYHGHRYVFLISCEAAELDAVGRVVDFSVIKARVGKWLDDTIDHGMVLQADDPLVSVLHALQTKFTVLPCPPTAENLAELVFRKAYELLVDTGVRVTKVECFETPNCSAVFP